MDSIITVNNISFFYKNLQALKDISFLVNPGDFIALMGVNGAGKSTLLNILHGTLSPCRGGSIFQRQIHQPEKSVCLYRIQCAASCCRLVFNCSG